MKGVIADVKLNKAVVLAENGQFITIKNKNYSVGQSIMLRNPAYTRYMSMAASFLLVVLLGVSGVGAYYTPVSYVDIEINPSIRLELNVFDKVINVVALNADGETVLKETKKLSKDVDICIEQIVEQSKSAGFVKADTDVSINVVSDKENISESIKECADNSDVHMTVKTETYNEHQKAEDDIISVEKTEDVQTVTEYPTEEHVVEVTVTAVPDVKTEAPEKSDNEKSEAQVKVTSTPMPEVVPTSTPKVKVTEKPKDDSSIKVTEKPKENPVIKATEKPKENPVIKATEEPKDKPVVKPTDKPKNDKEIKATEKPNKASKGDKNSLNDKNKNNAIEREEKEDSKSNKRFDKGSKPYGVQIEEGIKENSKLNNRGNNKR